jgi:hypothetical protein
MYGLFVIVCKISKYALDIATLVPGIECLVWSSSVPFVSKMDSRIGQQAVFRITVLSL